MYVCEGEATRLLAELSLISITYFTYIFKTSSLFFSIPFSGGFFIFAIDWAVTVTLALRCLVAIGHLSSYGRNEKVFLQKASLQSAAHPSFATPAFDAPCTSIMLRIISMPPASAIIFWLSLLKESLKERNQRTIPFLHDPCAQCSLSHCIYHTLAVVLFLQQLDYLEFGNWKINFF